MTRHLRRAPLGFGTRVIYDKPITLTATVPRAFLIERVHCIGEGRVTEVRVDGISVNVAVGVLPDLRPPISVPPNTLIEVDVAPQDPMPKPHAAVRFALRLLRRYRVSRWIVDSVPRLRRIRERSVNVGAKGYCE